MYKAYAIEQLFYIKRIPASDTTVFNKSWPFEQIINGLVVIESDQLKNIIFVSIHENLSLSDHDKILNTTLKILKETL